MNLPVLRMVLFPEGVGNERTAGDRRWMVSAPRLPRSRVEGAGDELGGALDTPLVVMHAL